MISDSPKSKVVQLYRPKDLDETSQVAVSGLDISKDKRELLVSYEHDQIYTFPIFPNSSLAGPTVDEITEMTKAMEQEGRVVQNELATYGGHLNRYTFLKNAKYAGPNDEYICTGSDSGHAWIYEKSSGCVAGFMNADTSTCNGVLPHPTLPFFVTYGIDKTAKLWRATVPVDRNVDDSPLGRAAFHHQMEYERSPIVQSWEEIKAKIENVQLDEDVDVNFLFPDELPSSNELLQRSFFMRFPGRYGDDGQPLTFIGNDLQNLPEVLRQNLFASIREDETGDDNPIRSSIDGLKRRIAVMRLKHQADQRGLIFNPSEPHILSAREGYKGCDLPSNSKDDGSLSYGDVVDSIPSFPADWMPYDREMSTSPLPCGVNFNTKDYDDFYSYHYSRLPGQFVSAPGDSEKERLRAGAERQTQEPAIASSVKGRAENDDRTAECSKEVEGNATQANTQSMQLLKDEGTDASESNFDRPYNILLEKITLLKEGGNHALSVGRNHLAARRYDQAIQYCSIAFFRFPSGGVKFLNELHKDDKNPLMEWSPLLKLLITTRLNLSLVMMKEPIRDSRKAAEQAEMAISELDPFTVEEGKVYNMKPKYVHKDNESHFTFKECKELQAKAYFRLGSAQSNVDFSLATRSLEQSIKCTRALGCQPDKVVRRLYADVKQQARKTLRQRKKLKAMFDDLDA